MHQKNVWKSSRRNDKITFAWTLRFLNHAQMLLHCVSLRLFVSYIHELVIWFFEIIAFRLKQRHASLELFSVFSTFYNIHNVVVCIVLRFRGRKKQRHNIIDTEICSHNMILLLPLRGFKSRLNKSKVNVKEIWGVA